MRDRQLAAEWGSASDPVGPDAAAPEAPATGGATDLPEATGLRKVAAVLRRSWVRYLGAFVCLGLVVAFLVVPQFRSGLHDLALLKRIPAWWIVAGAMLEAVSFVAYGLFTRGVLPAEGRPSFHRLLRVDVIGAGLTHILPGGGATASGVRFRMLRDAGVDGTDAAFGSVLQGLGSAIVISGLLLVGVFMVLPTHGGNKLYLLGAAVGFGLVLVVATLWVILVRAEEHSVRFFRRAARRLGHGDMVERVVRRVAVRLHELAHNPRLLAKVVLWSAANWLFDAASLWVFVKAFGYRVDLGGILVAFGLANTLAILPVTPGGVGIIEGILVPSLVGFGAPRNIALLGVLTWRLFNFWAPIPAGAVAWISLALGRGGSRGSRTSLVRT